MISCFADPPSETPLFSEARVTLYDEEDNKVRLGWLPAFFSLLFLSSSLGLNLCCCGFQNVQEEPIHILNVAIRWADHFEDEMLVPIFRAFAQSKVFPSALTISQHSQTGRGWPLVSLPTGCDLPFHALLLTCLPLHTEQHPCWLRTPKNHVFNSSTG